eukprot:CAMPEP_0119413290 /NCGR_PEP_ID=MMETSP1335-20130426/5427_1 /TAXON_ID=259385 /ORGANISM="Chrysoculter rhomboideus, Strain RCC1486" /LENGTH=90 /DNA_ID=CAMNT_0007438073 /DNA_START=192 /DNA_END=461 /DNA_ORIENTATION=+
MHALGHVQGFALHLTEPAAPEPEPCRQLPPRVGAPVCRHGKRAIPAQSRADHMHTRQRGDLHGKAHRWLATALPRNHAGATRVHATVRIQ